MRKGFTRSSRSGPQYSRDADGRDGPRRHRRDRRRRAPDGNLLAYGTDHDGGEVYRLHIRNLSTGENLEEVIERTSGGTAWSADNDVLFYMRPDEMMRPYQVWRHVIGTKPETDTLGF